MSRPPAECGTDRGYQRHQREGSYACRPCKDAHAAYERGRRAKPPTPRELVPCGSPSAWRRHKRRGEEPCEACVLAHRAEVARYQQSRKRRAA